MDHKYREHIRKNLVELCTTTICHSALLARLSAQNVLSDIDVQSLELPSLTRFDKSKRLYEILQTKSQSYHKLMAALKETKQTGALEVLVQQCCSVVQKIFVHGELDAADENGEIPLFMVIHDGGLGSEIKEIIALGADPKNRNRKGRSVLHKAAKYGNVDAMKYFISLGVEINSKDNEEKTVLHMVAKATQNFTEVLAFLLEKKLEINDVDKDGNNLILLAAFWGRSVEELEIIVNTGGDWEHKNQFGRSVLHQATEGGNVEALKYFISLGADINWKDNEENTVLHVIGNIKQNFNRTLEFLLEQKLCINAVNKYGSNLVFVAVLWGRSKEELEAVVNLGGEWQHKDSFGRSVLHRAAEGGNVEALKYFISLGADINCMENEGRTVFHAASSARQNFKQTLIFLLEKKLDINATDKFGENLVRHAAYWGRTEEELKTVVNLGGDWRHQNNIDQSILHRAAEGGNVEALKYFISLGADINRKDNEQRTVLHMLPFTKPNFKQTLEFLLEKKLTINETDKYGNNLLHHAIFWGRSEVELETIVNFGGDWMQSNMYGKSILHIAARVGNVKALKYFISLGADIHCKDNEQGTLLHTLAITKQNFRQALTFLLEKKLDINAVTKYGNNLLLITAFFPRSKGEFENIVNLGGDWRHHNNLGQSILHRAAEGGNVEALKYFISLGADISSKDNDEMTPLHSVAKATQNFNQTLEFLLQKKLEINAVTFTGNNLVFLAAYWGRSGDELKKIVHLGGDWKHKNDLGESVLHLAAEGGNVEALKYFISLGADPHCCDIALNTPLDSLRSAKQNVKEALDVLISHGVKFNVLGSWWRTFRHMHQREGKYYYLQLMKKHL